MSAADSENSTKDKRVNEIVADYLRSIERGELPDRTALLARHVDLANELTAFFADHDRFRRAAAPLADALTLPPSESPESGPKRTIRYFGDYELLEEIARGGMGVVYKARQMSLNRPVALKMILAGQLASENDVKRFYSEAEAAATLDHPNIVPIFEVGQHEGQHYFAMGYIDGPSLAAKLDAAGWPTSEAARLVRQIADAIQYAHARGVIHRDLKPQNVLLGADGVPRITDFGLAKRSEDASNLTTTGQILGTPSYMSPEQAAGKTREIGPLTDVYSLGAILYALLTGRPPFEGPDVISTISRVIFEEPTSPRRHNPQVDQDLETITLKCLAKDPAERYSSARELADDLDRFLRDEPIRARPVGSMETAWRWCRRKPLVASLVSVISLLLLIGAVGGTTLAVISNRNARRADQNASLASEETVKARIAQSNAEEEQRRADTNAAQAERRRLEAESARNTAEAEKHKAETARHEADESSRQAKAEADRANWLLYAREIGDAEHEWEVGDVAAAWRHLNSSRRDLRGWEYHYLDTLFNQNQKTINGHAYPVTSVAFSPDGKRITSGCLDGTVKVWSASSGHEAIALAGHNGAVNSVAFSPDGQRIASGSEDRTVKVWDATSGVLFLTLKGHTNGVSSVAFSTDSKRIASGSQDKTVKVWDASSGQQTLTLNGHTGIVSGVAFSPDGKRIASASQDDTLKVWDARTGRETLTLIGHANGLYGVAFSPDGTRVASGAERTVKVWDTTSGEVSLTLRGHNGYVFSVAFSRDGKRIVSGSLDTTVKVWDARSGHETLALKGHTSKVWSVAFSPDGLRIASGSGDVVPQRPASSGPGTIKVWDATRGQETLTLKGHTGYVSSVEFDPRSQRIASASGDGTVKVWNATSGEVPLILNGHTYAVTSVAFSPDGQRIAGGSEDRLIKVWDATSGEVSLTLKGHTDIVNSVAFSPDGQRIASGCRDGTVKVWDASSGQETLILKGHTKGVNSVAFSPDGNQIVSGSSDKTIKVWDARTGRETVTLRGHTNFVNSVAFSPDSQRIASGSGDPASRDGTVKVWDARSGQETLALKGHTGAVWSVAFSPDGERIASGSRDDTVKLWDARRGEEILTLKGHTSGVYSVAWSPDGKRIASGSVDNTVKVWDGSSGQLR